MNSINSSSNLIQMIDLNNEYSKIKPEIDTAILEVLHRGDFINGKEVKFFEQSLSNYLNSTHSIACANGTDALQIALMSLGIGLGDEVIVPAFAYISVVEVIVLLGAKPIFIDIDDAYFFIDTTQLQNLIGPKCKAIIAVNLFGQCGNLGELIDIAEKNNVHVIEDNAQSLGATYIYKGVEKHLGLWAEIGCTSFFPTKNLGCYGDGGAIFTSNIQLEKKIRMISSHGQQKKYVHNLIGVNSRLDTIQAAILNVKLQYLDEQLLRKKNIVEDYNRQLSVLEDLILPKQNLNCKPAWHQYTIKVKNGKRDLLKQHLQNKGIVSMVYYPIIIPEQVAYEGFAIDQNFPKSKEASQMVLSLPLHSNLTNSDISFIVETIKEFYHV